MTTLAIAAWSVICWCWGALTVTKWHNEDVQRDMGFTNSGTVRNGGAWFCGVNSRTGGVETDSADVLSPLDPGHITGMVEVL